MAQKIDVLDTNIRYNKMFVARGEFWVEPSFFSIRTQKYRGSDIASLKVLATRDVKSITNTIASAALGKVIAGNTGAIIGAFLAGDKRIVAFEAVFKDGKYLRAVCNADEYRALFENKARADNAIQQGFTAQQYEKQRFWKMYRIPIILFSIIGIIMLIGILGQPS